jgi:hypothetical protein
MTVKYRDQAAEMNLKPEAEFLSLPEELQSYTLYSLMW